MQERDRLMEHTRGAEEPEASRLAVARQAAHLVSGPLNLYRHYEVGVVDWLEDRKVNEVSMVGRRQEALATPGPLGGVGRNRSHRLQEAPPTTPCRAHNIPSRYSSLPPPNPQFYPSRQNVRTFLS